MTRARIFAISFVAALALSSGALAQGGGGGGGGAGGGGAGSGAGAASGASGTTGNSSGRTSGPSGNSVAQSSGGQSGPNGNGAAQPPAARAKIVLTSQGRELGRGTVLRALKVNCNRHQGAALPWDNQGIDLRFPAIAMIQASVQAFTSASPLRHEPSALRAAR